MGGPSAEPGPDVCRMKVSQRCASETGPVREKMMVPAGETANGLLSGKPSIFARTGSMALALDTTDISATGNREDCGASRRFGESNHSRPTVNGQIGCFLSGKVARRQRKKENASVAQGLEFVRATTDVLVSCENQPATATRFREPFLVRRVVGKDIPVRDERNVGGAKGAIKLALQASRSMKSVNASGSDALPKAQSFFDFVNGDSVILRHLLNRVARCKTTHDDIRLDSSPQ